MYHWFSLSKIYLFSLVYKKYYFLSLKFVSISSVFDSLTYLQTSSILIIVAYFLYKNKKSNFQTDDRPIKPEIKEHQQTEEFYRQTVENSPNPIFSVNKQGEIKIWNVACQQNYHYHQEIIGQSWKILLADESLSPLESILAQVFQEKKSFSGVEITYRGADQTKHCAISRLYPLFDAHQQVSQCVIANTHITERKQTELEREKLLAREQA
ncbi:MAG: PAS domain-containing protein [Limnoraphis sp.]